MITEFIVAGALVFSMDHLIHRKSYSIKKNFMQVCYRVDSLINRQSETLKIFDITFNKHGYKIKLTIPYGIPSQELDKHLDEFKEGLKLQSISLVYDRFGKFFYLNCIEKFIYTSYQAVELKPYEILIGENDKGNIIVNLNKYPHVLIGGDTGTGKSRLLLTLLTNLINNSNNIDLYLLQIRKNDLGVFKNCKQVKSNSRTLEEVLESLELINSIASKRETLIDNTKGIYSIDDYIRITKNEMNYIYVVIEEFSFLNISKGDNKHEKMLKAQCLKYIKSIVNVGRSSGIFLITSLQKPTSDSIPADIKAQLTTRISLKITDIPTSIVILGNDLATKLQEREFICRTLDDVKGYTYTIDHEIITKAIIENVKEVAAITTTEVSTLKEEDEVSNLIRCLNEITR